MIILLVDDEYAVREALEVLVDWKEYGITRVLYAENGVEALEIMEQTEPDIMFCDMEMPKMNGIQLLEEVKRRQYKTKVVAISGYTEFRYVKSTLQAGGLDYVLKPIDRDEIIAALEKAITKRQEDIEEERRRLREKTDKEEVFVQVLRDWLSSKSSYMQQVEQALSGLYLNAKHLSVCLVVFQNPEKVCDLLFEGDRVLMRFALENVIKEVCNHGNCRMVDIDRYLSVIITDGTFAQNRSVVMEQFTEFCLQFYSLSFIHVWSQRSVEASGVLSEVERLKQLLLDQKMPYGSQEKTKTLPTLSFSIEKQLQVALTERNMDGINRLLEAYSKQLMEYPELSYRDVQMLTMEANHMISRMKHQQKARDVKSIEPMSIWVFHLQIWKEELKHRLYSLMEYQEESKLNIESVYRYLEDHYAENLSIDTLTEHFFQSPQYISKRFKERYGTTIVTVLRNIRIEHAKRYLETTSLPIIEIAKLTGYEDENYFSKVFKKEVGMSPKSYRGKA